MSKRPKAVASGVIFGGLADVYNLDDGRRVLSQRGGLRALSGAAGNGTLDRHMARFPAGPVTLTVPPTLEFDLPGGGTAKGIEAIHFVDVLRAYKAAWRSDQLLKSQHHLAKNADAMLDALAVGGIAALIDEATGFERVRATGTIARIFEWALRRQKVEWEVMFPESLVRAIDRLHGGRWSGGSHPRYMASTNQKLYQMLLGTPVAEEMHLRVHVDGLQARQGNNWHQFLSEQAREYFREQLQLVEVIAKQSAAPRDFWLRMHRQYPEESSQTELLGPEWVS